VHELYPKGDLYSDLNDAQAHRCPRRGINIDFSDDEDEALVLSEISNGNKIVITMKTQVFVIVMKTGDDCRAVLAMTQ